MEIQKLLDEFDNDQLQFVLELEVYEKERIQVEGEQEEAVHTDRLGEEPSEQSQE
mgnify:CR=1 FL=1